jgi:hypothetical protein
LNIDASEFGGDVKILSKFLKIKVRDSLKHALYKLEPGSYHVASTSGSLKIKQVKSRSYRIKQKERAPPSAHQTMPFFFPR